MDTANNPNISASNCDRLLAMEYAKRAAERKLLTQRHGETFHNVDHPIIETQGIDNGSIIPL